MHKEQRNETDAHIQLYI